MDGYLGVDVGSVTTKCAVITEVGELIAYNYLCTQGKPVSAVQQGLRKVRDNFPLMWSRTRSLLRLRLPFIMSRTYVLSSRSVVKVENSSSSVTACRRFSH
jgi:hypothetical protein